MAFNVAGLCVVVVFYIVIIVVAFLAARYIETAPDGETNKTEMSMVAGRNLHVGVGIFTMSGTELMFIIRFTVF